MRQAAADVAIQQWLADHGVEQRRIPTRDMLREVSARDGTIIQRVRVRTSVLDQLPGTGPTEHNGLGGDPPR